MKKTLSLLLMIITILFIFSLSNYVCAASSSMSTSTSSATVGDTITVTVKVNAAQWNLKLTANGTELDTWAETLNYSENLSKTFTVSYKPTKSGTVEFVLSGDYTDVDQTNKEINITKSVTVKEKSTSGGGSSSGGSNSGNSGNSGNSSGNNNGSTTTQKPNFKSADRTVYTTGTTNLRSSWSTSSSATTVPAGTALTLTGTSSETINGYVWYRVKYNGATKYVASNLVTNTKPQEKKETEKSDNNDLASLEIEGVTLEPSFSKDVTEYTVQLKDDVTELNIDAQAESSKAKVKISGNEDLKDGENTITITVTAEDESTKEYTIKAIKGEGSSASPVDNSVLKLSNLEISGVDFAGIFNPDTHSYELNLNISVKNLKITATPNQEGATVEIIGNENFVEGENMVTILVTSADGSQTATYQIKVVMPSEAIENKDNIQFYLICGGIVLAAIIVIIVAVVIFKKRKNSTETEEDLDDIYSSPLKNTSEEKENKKEEARKEKKSQKGEILDKFLDTSEVDEQPKRPRGRHSR